MLCLASDYQSLCGGDRILQREKLIGCLGKNYALQKKVVAWASDPYIHFNQGLLCKQAWRILTSPNSLFGQIMKARYFPHTDFLHSEMGTYPSLTWRSNLWGKELLQKGLRWSIWDSVSIHSQPWIPRPIIFKPLNLHSQDDEKVSEFIISCKSWDSPKLHQFFHNDELNYILSIPLEVNSR